MIISSTKLKKNYFYLISLEFVIEIDKNFRTKVKMNHHYNRDTIIVKKYLLLDIYSFTLGGKNLCNVNHMTIKTISD